MKELGTKKKKKKKSGPFSSSEVELSSSDSTVGLGFSGFGCSTFLSFAASMIKKTGEDKGEGGLQKKTPGAGK